MQKVWYVCVVVVRARGIDRAKRAQGEAVTTKLILFFVWQSKTVKAVPTVV